MTTPRRKRTKQEQVSDVLVSLLHVQRAKLARSKAKYEDDLAALSKTLRVLEALGQEMLPGMEVTSSPTAVTSTTLEQPFIVSGTDSIIASTASEEGAPPESEGAPPKQPRHRQRIGEKAEINDVWDVWPAPELGPMNHSKLMYSRREACPLCFKGVPYATKTRTDHHVVTLDAEGMERGFEYKPCTGAT